MQGSEKSNFAQQTARLSWQLFLFTIVFAFLSRRIPGALLIFEGLAFLTMLAGAVCGIIALAGIPRMGTAKVLFPALAGVILNSLLLFIFITNFITARQSAQQRVQARTVPASAPVLAPAPAPRRAPVQATSPTSHLGTWQTRTPRGDVMNWTFTSDEITMVMGTKQTTPFPYEIDYTKNPPWLTIHGEKSGRPPTLLIVDFPSETRMRVLGPAPKSSARPIDFSPDRTDVLTFERQP